MKDASDLFSKRLQQLGLKKQVDAAMVVESAQKTLREIFGSRADENLQVISFVKGTLKIAAKNSAWASECQGHLLKLQKDPVKKVVFVNFIIDKDRF